MFTGIAGLGWTAFSMVRSNKYLMYGLAAAAFVVVLLVVKARYDKGLKRQGAQQAATAAAAAIIATMEKNRELHAEIRRLPLSERAARLRQTDSAGS